MFYDRGCTMYGGGETKHIPSLGVTVVKMYGDGWMIISILRLHDAWVTVWKMYAMSENGP